MMGIEAGTDTAEGEKGANEQRRADQQHQRQRDLADDEQRPSLALPEAGAGAVAALLQSRVQVGPRGAESREESEQDAGEQRDGKGEGEYAPIDADGGAVFANTRQAGRAHGQQGAHSHEAEQQAKNAASDGEQDAFGEQLADDACPAGSECGADRKFASASRGADQQKISHVGAGDEKHEADRAKQHQQRLTHVANDTVAERFNGETLLRIGDRVGAEVLAGSELHLRVGLGQRYARFEQSRGLEVVALIGAVGFELEGQPDVGFWIGEEVLSQDADDGVGLVAQGKRAADDVGIAAEFALPESVTQHHGFAPVGGVFLRGEGAAQNDRCAEEAEVTLSDMDSVDLLRPVAGEVEAGTRKVVGGDLFEDARLLLPDMKLRNGANGIAAIGRR